jgi:adenosylmethionine-8-amino-7-oxononanoate aminotransferase
LETLRIYETDKLIENAVLMGEYMNQQVDLLKQKHRSIGDFRNTGLLGCLELVKNRETREPMAPFNAKPEEMDRYEQGGSQDPGTGDVYVRALGIYIYCTATLYYQAANR